MEIFLGKTGIRLFERHLEQYKPEDPLYEFYTDSQGKKKRRKRATPPGLSARDAEILKSVQRRAHYLDKGFSIFGFQFGWTFFIGLIPFVGDAVNVYLDYRLVVKKARQADIPLWLLHRMLFHILVGAGVGFVPAIGDVLVAVYKPNSRNAGLLMEFMRIRGEEYMRLQAEEAIVTSSGSRSQVDSQGRGLSKADQEQVKPGAGLVQGEISQITGSNAAPNSTDVRPSIQSPPKKRLFRFFGMSGADSPAA
ncbi:hypothetical protein C0993_009172 [Termitomyces sp. T159_Od127]|nr:hypothetical protein C0993_009172 [Termitomyces sp. T159_Od127]